MIFVSYEGNEKERHRRPTPIKNPVPARETIVPNAYSIANNASWAKNRTIEPRRLSKKPTARLNSVMDFRGSSSRLINTTHQPINPYNLVVRDSPRNLNAESPSKNCVSGTPMPADSRLSQPLLAILVDEEEEKVS